jgi:hypothetical protein
MSLDHTLKVAKKAKIVSRSLEYKTPFSGGWLSVINEHGQTLSWVCTTDPLKTRLITITQRLCETGAHDEITGLLKGIKDHHDICQLPLPVSCTADNCCAVEKAIQNAMPEIEVKLDLWHCQQRYVSQFQFGSHQSHPSKISGHACWWQDKSSSEYYFE